MCGCAAPREEVAEDAIPTIRLAGDVVLGAPTIIPATVGTSGGDGMEPAPPFHLEIGADVSLTIPRGSGVSVDLPASTLEAGPARLRIVNHGDWARLALRWDDPQCLVTLRTPYQNATMAGGPIGAEATLGQEWPYADYAFEGTCEGRLYTFWLERIPTSS